MHMTSKAGDAFHALYPISGNPPTWGHADVMERAARIFDRVTWAIAVNPAKSYLFSAGDRMEMMNEYVRHFRLNNVTVAEYQGATVRFAEMVGARVIVKGLRNASDLQAEMEQAMGNRNMNDRIDTVSLFTSPRYSVISSSLIRELALLGESIEPYVLDTVARRIKAILAAKGLGRP
jgi:pantetheine-phosphate adenylyltransferase